MKKYMALLLVVVLGMALLIGCSTGNIQGENGQSENGQSENGQSENGQGEEKILLTDTEAWALVEEWLEDHPEMTTPYEETTIAAMDDEMYSYENEDYYLFYLNGYYWLDILVNTETGYMLARVTEESDEPVEPEIEPLMDYYNRYY